MQPRSQQLDDFTIGQYLVDAAAILSEISESPRLDAEILMGLVLRKPRSFMHAWPEKSLDLQESANFEALVRRRYSGEPVAYITGIREFWSIPLRVSPQVLIPRPDTELLVEKALLHIPDEDDIHVLDLGTGSGAIAISIAAERPLCSITATDASADALAIARQNVRQADLANVTCLSGNWTEPVADKQFTIIVSNPPYVREDDEALSNLRFEPLSALASGKDGLDDIRILAAHCMPLLTNDGWLMMEHGAEQKDAVAAVLEEAGWRDITCHNDLAGLPRVTAARRDVK